MNTIAENVAATSGQAQHKAHDLAHRPRYFVSAVLAGAYIGIGEVLLLVAVSPFVAKGSAAVRLLEGAVFPVALTIVMFAGAQLFTSNVMVMLIGALSGRTGVRDLASSWVLSLAGNLAGAFAFGAMVHASGVTSSPSARAMLAEMVHGKTALSGGQLFWRAVLCNMLVCLAVWMFTRARGTRPRFSCCGSRWPSSWRSDSNIVSQTWPFSASRSWMAQRRSVTFSGI